eukprot:TRINITY_DN35035_c0_g1_i1.p1 TRINITY_DN35035_c0_g1~~TRINITY_DN35035_c0_g1_i1.p1  ORF type:complete len:487 (-),score=44.92 TRINITY_DN35035_c0_g1_i1:238-1698(-)
MLIVLKLWRPYWFFVVSAGLVRAKVTRAGGVLFRHVLMPIEVVVHGHAITRFGHVWAVDRASAVPKSSDWRWSQLKDGDRFPCRRHKSEDSNFAEETLCSCFFRAASPNDMGFRGWLTPDAASCESSIVDVSHPLVVAVTTGAPLDHGEADTVAMDVHDRVAATALAWRRGTFATMHCTKCCHNCSHQNVIDLGWILRGLIPKRLRIVNVGCRNLGRDDPTHLLIRDHKGEIEGFCLDVDDFALAEAASWLRGLGDHVRSFVTVSAAVMPETASQWVLPAIGESGVGVGVGAAYARSSIEPWTVLKVDLDTFDEAVVSEMLRALAASGQAMPLVLVVEYEAIIPPPYRLRCLYTAGVPLESSDCNQPSLSYWIHQLASYGYFLYKLSERDLVFLHGPIAHAAALRDGVVLPLDEFACYFQQRMHQSTRDLDEALNLLQSNASCLSSVSSALDTIVQALAPKGPSRNPVAKRFSFAFEASHPLGDKL